MDTFACNITDNSTAEAKHGGFSVNNMIGLGLAVSSSFFIGASFVINKKSLERIIKRQKKLSPERHRIRSDSCSSGWSESSTESNIGFAFLKEPLWWLGIACMGFGEVANFSAYIFSPASLVTPLGALSVVVTCILSTYFLDERMNLLSKLGVVLAVMGSMFVVVHAPSQEVIKCLDILYYEYFAKLPFLVYAAVQLTAIIVLTFFQTKHYLIRILLSSFSGAFCVICTKSVGIGITQAFQQPSGLLTNWFFYLVLAGLFISIAFQMVQVTKALEMTDASTAMPIFYVTFTMSVIIGMNVLFREYESMNRKSAISILLGFGVLCAATFLLQAFKPLHVYTIKDVQKHSKETARMPPTVNQMQQTMNNSRASTELNGTRREQGSPRLDPIKFGTFCEEKTMLSRNCLT